MPLSHQQEPNRARMVREIDRDRRSVERRIDAVVARVDKLEEFEEYIRTDLRTWLEDFATFAGFGTAFPEPPV